MNMKRSGLFFALLCSACTCIDSNENYDISLIERINTEVQEINKMPERPILKKGEIINTETGEKIEIL